MTHHYCAALHHKHVSLTGSLSNIAGNMEEPKCLCGEEGFCVCVPETHTVSLNILDTIEYATLELKPLQDFIRNNHII